MIKVNDSMEMFRIDDIEIEARIIAKVMKEGTPYTPKTSYEPARERYQPPSAPSAPSERYIAIMPSEPGRYKIQIGDIEIF